MDDPIFPVPAPQTGSVDSDTDIEISSDGEQSPWIPRYYPKSELELSMIAALIAMERSVQDLAKTMLADLTAGDIRVMNASLQFFGLQIKDDKHARVPKRHYRVIN